MTLKIDLTAMQAHELKRLFIPKDFEAACLALEAAKTTNQPIFAPDEYPDVLELVVAEESDWDALGASLVDVRAAKSARDSLQSMGFKQVGAFKFTRMPYLRNFFAYTKESDTFAVLYLSDANGQAPYIEAFSVFRTERAGRIAIVVTSASEPETLDPSERLVWLPLPNASPEQVFQLLRGKVLELGKANRKAESESDFKRAYLDIVRENFRVWVERGVLKITPEDAT